METILSTLSVLPTTKQEFESFISKALIEFSEGERNPLEWVPILKAMEDIAKTIKDSDIYKNAIQRELGMYAEKDFEYKGFKYSKGERTYYDFKDCKYSGYLNAKNNLESIENMLKNLSTPLYDAESGEEVLRPTKKTSYYVSVKLK